MAGAFITYMGVWVLMMFTMDFARLARPEGKKYHGWVTFGPLFYLLAFGGSAFIGVFVTNSVPLPDSDFGEASAAVAIVELMGVLGVLLIFITQARINTANLTWPRSTSSRFVARVFRLRLPRTVWAAVAAAICWVVAVVVGIFLLEKDGLNADLMQLAPIITVVIAATVYAASISVWRPAILAQGAGPRDRGRPALGGLHPVRDVRQVVCCSGDGKARRWKPGAHVRIVRTGHQPPTLATTHPRVGDRPEKLTREAEEHE